MIAEAVVSFAIEKLGDLLIDEGVFLHELRGQVEWLEAELRMMQAFLKDADTKQNDELVKIWVANVRDIAYKAEDVIDNFILKIEQHRRRGSVGFVRRCISYFDEPFARHQLGKKIQEIKNDLLEIGQRRKTYGIKNLSQGGEGSSSMGERLREQKQTSPLLEETEIVGFQEDIETLVARLIEGELWRCVISVVGIGGIGKTALTRKVYNNVAVKKHFNCCAWIYVSQEYVARDLLRSIMRCFVTSPRKEMEETQMKEMIFEYLKKKRYLVVVDGICNIEAWNALAAAFPDMNNGSRVLLTTRNRDVASYADARSRPHELQRLGEEESWELFCKKTFIQQDPHWPPHLEGLGREIVAKCHGLPLAVVIIAGLLSRKAGLPSEWEKVLKNRSWQFVEGEAQISRIFSLCYEDLSYHLKPCFLYIGVYPKDKVFSAKELIWLWVAEGFVHSRGAGTLEEAAEDCLEELIQRSLIQIVKRSSTGAVKSCRIHNLLRDISISKAKEENFLDVQSAGTKTRRLAIHNGTPTYIFLNGSTSSLRSIIWFYEELLEKQQKSVFGGFQLLRVLHLHNTSVKEVPNEIGTLIHLRYLRVTVEMNTAKSLPSSIANLCNLQTLHVHVSHQEISIHIPIDIWKMQKLRHVCVEEVFTCEGSKAGRLTANELSFPSELKILKAIEADDWIENCLGKLINLRKLEIVRVDSSRHRKGLFDSIPKLDHLESLTLQGDCIIRFPPILNLLHLYKLSLIGRLEKLPEPHEFSPNLTKLTLDHSYLEQDPMTTLEKLANLRILILNFHSYMGKEMVCSAQGFPRLESLKLIYLDDLEEWRVEEGAMPGLLHLHIYECIRLKTLPEGLQHVTSLRKLEINSMPPRFRDRLQKDKGEDWHKIQHIPSIDIKMVFIQN